MESECQSLVTYTSETFFFNSKSLIEVDNSMAYYLIIDDHFYTIGFDDGYNISQKDINNFLSSFEEI